MAKRGGLARLEEQKEQYRREGMRALVRFQDFIEKIKGHATRYDWSLFVQIGNDAELAKLVDGAHGLGVLRTDDDWPMTFFDGELHGVLPEIGTWAKLVIVSFNHAKFRNMYLGDGEIAETIEAIWSAIPVQPPPEVVQKAINDGRFDREGRIEASAAGTLLQHRIRRHLETANEPQAKPRPSERADDDRLSRLAARAGFDVNAFTDDQILSLLKLAVQLRAA